MKKPWQDEALIADYVEQGFTRSEAKACIVADVVETRVDRMGSLPNFDFYCQKCDVSTHVHLGSTFKTIAYQHVGHGFRMEYYR